MKKFSTLFVYLIMCGMLFTSCDTPEEKVYSDLKDLYSRIESDASSFDADDWEDVMEEFDDIHYDIQYCDFTDEQWREIGYMDGRLTVVIAKEATKALLNEYAVLVKKISKYSRGYAEGVQDGIHEDITDKDVEEINSTIKDVYDEVENDWNDFDVDKNNADFERFKNVSERVWNEDNNEK